MNKILHNRLNSWDIFFLSTFNPSFKSLITPLKHIIVMLTLANTTVKNVMHLKIKWFCQMPYLIIYISHEITNLGCWLAVNDTFGFIHIDKATFLVFLSLYLSSILLCMTIFGPVNQMHCGFWCIREQVHKLPMTMSDSQHAKNEESLITSPGRLRWYVHRSTLKE